MIATTVSSISIPNSLLENIVEKSSKKINAAITKARINAQDELKIAIISQLESSRIVRGLRSKESTGAGLVTVRAEFGLTRQMGQDAADTIMSIIEHLVKKPTVTNEKTRLGRKFTIEADIVDETYRSKLKQNSSLSYVSEKSGILIQWIKWLLDGTVSTTGTPKLARYGISYPERIIPGKSRSGQAIMIQNSRSRNKRVQNYRFPYQLPTSLRPSGKYVDFVDEALGNPRFVARLRRIIELSLTAELNRILR